MKHISIFLLLFISINIFSQAFSFSQDFTDIGPISTITSTISQASGKTTNASFFGGEIDYIVTSTNASSDLNVFNNTFFMGFQTAGSIEYIWDGVDADSLGIFFGNSIASLGSCGSISVDFSESSFDTATLYFNLTIEMYNSANNYISWTGPIALSDIPVTATVNTALFQSFGPSAFNFNDLRALRIVLSTENGNNLAADILSVSWVPDLSTNATCAPIPAVQVPAMGQWAVIALSLLLIVFGIIAVNQNNLALNEKRYS